MKNIRRGIFADAFSQTFHNRVIAEERPVLTGVIGFLGLPLKFKNSKASGSTSAKVAEQVSIERDRNIYNWLEQIVFLPLRLLKNTAKLGTEFLPHAAANAIDSGANNLKARAEAIYNGQKSVSSNSEEVGNVQKAELYSKYVILMLSAYAVSALALLPRLLAKVGQSITSPFAALKDTQKAVQAQTQVRGVANFVAFMHGLFILAALTSAAVFAAPLFGYLLTVYGPQASAGLLSSFGSAMTWVGSLPVLSSIGSAFATALTSVSTVLGVSVPTASFVSAAALSAAVIVAAPVLAGLKAVVRYLSPFKPSFPAVSDDAVVAAKKSQNNGGDLQLLVNKGNKNNQELQTLPKRTQHNQDQQQPLLNKGAAANTSDIINGSGLQPLPVPPPVQLDQQQELQQPLLGNNNNNINVPDAPGSNHSSANNSEAEESDHEAENNQPHLAAPGR